MVWQRLKLRGKKLVRSSSVKVEVKVETLGVKELGGVGARL